jgi:hypothetical protein
MLQDRDARALEKHPEARQGVIGDNGEKFVAKDSKEFIRLFSLTHARTKSCYP